MRAAVAIFAIRGLSLVIVISSCIRVSVSAYYDNNEYSDTHLEEGSGYYYGTGQYERAFCDMTLSIGFEEEFMVYNFPPGPWPQRPPPQLAYLLGQIRGPMSIVPEQCIWEFETYKETDCILEFRSHYFERGDVDCEQQYLLIGDEYGEKRVCGFTQPPRHFISSGRKLFLGHYRRNGHKQTVAASLNGMVRCMERPRQQGYTDTGNLAYHANSSAGSCPPPPKEPQCTPFPELDMPVSTDPEVFSHVVLVAPPSANISLLDKNLVCQGDNGCVAQAQVCFQTSPIGCSATIAGANPFKPGDGAQVQCVNATSACGQPGDCDAAGDEGHASGQHPIPVNVHCSAPVDHQCTFTAAFCTKTL